MPPAQSKPKTALCLSGDPLVTQLVGYWPFERIAGAQTDLTPKRNSAKLDSTVQWRNGIRGLGADFRGTSKGVLRGVVPISDNTIWSVSWEMTYPVAVAGQPILIVIGGAVDDTPGTGGIGVRDLDSSGIAQFYIRHTDYSAATISIGRYVLGTHCFTVTKNGTTYTGYMDGGLIGTTTSSSTYDWSTQRQISGNATIQFLQPNSPLYWVAVHNRTLTPADVSLLHSDPYRLISQPGPTSWLKIKPASGAASGNRIRRLICTGKG